MARELATNNTTRNKVQQVVTRKGVMLEVVGIDGVATKSDLTNWVNSAQAEITSVRDPDGQYPASKGVLKTREWSYIVDLSTMKIVAKFFGSYGGGQASITALNNALDDINKRL